MLINFINYHFFLSISTLLKEKKKADCQRLASPLAKMVQFKWTAAPKSPILTSATAEICQSAGLVGALNNSHLDGPTDQCLKIGYWGGGRRQPRECGTERRSRPEWRQRSPFQWAAGGGQPPRSLGRRQWRRRRPRVTTSAL